MVWQEKILSPKERNSWQKTLLRYWDLLCVLVPQTLHARYRGSYLGVYWSLLNPVIMTALYTTIFGTAFASYYDNSLVNYVLAAFTGLLVIHFYNSSTTQALTSVVSNGELLNKIRVPTDIFPLTMIGANIVQFLIGPFPILVIITLLKSGSVVHVFLLLIPFISLVLVCTGVGFIVSALFVFFRDLGYFYEVATFIVWISSPVFYPPEIVPSQVKPFLNLNPLVAIIESLRQISLTPDFPEPFFLLGVISYGIILSAFGYMFFRKLEPEFLDLL
ncbi:MAG TPA: ABC transporter permease [Geminocystis sp. M7585_C2015_104]|nr:ABC transporter permease [Geminocystis sp. M7585_C2015_104]